LEAEREMNKQFEEAQMQNLPPVRVNRTAVPPGFQVQDVVSDKGTHVANPTKPHTPAF
jgi:hypothetical protein